jgi:hypothetical protein
MMNFCTLFNSHYIHKGLATYLSLKKVTDDFHLYVVAFDQDCYDRLKSYNLKHLTVERLEDFETPKLLAVKEDRNMAEYCWTCSSAVTYHFITKYNLSSITYLDADLYFINTPQILFDEIDDASVALSEHWFDYNNERAGRFCVQFVYFKNDEIGMAALKYWRDKCLEWCFARYEDGKYGDQSYIEDIYNQFEGVHVIQNRGCGVAPWNYHHYEFPDGRTVKFQGEKYPLIFYHFHGTKFIQQGNSLVLTPVDHDIPEDKLFLFYIPYLNVIKDVYNNYLSKSITNVLTQGRPLWRRKYDAVKHKMHANPIAKFLYYKVFNVKYNGYENKK